MAFRVDDFDAGRVTFNGDRKRYLELIKDLPETLLFPVDHDWSRENCNAAIDSCTIAFGIEHAYPWLRNIAVNIYSVRFTLPSRARIAVPTPHEVCWTLSRQDHAIEGHGTWPTGIEWFEIPLGVRDVSDHGRLADERRAYEAANPDRRKGPDAKYAESLASRTDDEAAKRQRQNYRTKGRMIRRAGEAPPVNVYKKS